jgi:CMP-N-acetylneuraminic acid synthetase/mannose-6-phosphate isomerase-like protein (cupin superfamily)
MKKVAMIPMALGSTRIKDKNLLLVDGWPMCYYVVRACQKAGVFDEIYINSEHDIFRRYANDLGVNFYKRPAECGGSNCTMESNSRKCDGERCQVHDHYLRDFIDNVCAVDDLLIQIHTTSPLLKPETIAGFVNGMIYQSSPCSSQFSVVNIHEETFLSGNPVNFDMKVKTPTQDLNPVQPISWAMAGWWVSEFVKAYDAGEGCTFINPVRLVPIDKIEAIDVDSPDDLFLAEACLSHMKRKEDVGKFYYTEDVLYIEDDLIDLIKKDGSPCPEELGYNRPHTKLSEVKKTMGDGSWCYPIVYSSNDQVALIKHNPGEGCRKHYHATKDEYWYVIEGEFTWTLGMDENEKIVAKAGEFVFLPKGTIHYMTCTSNTPGIRMANGGRDMDHVYV